jgi:lysophospholipase L1-like esterase
MVEDNRAEETADRFFAMLGRSVVAFFIIATILELISFAALSVHRRRQRDPFSPQESPTYDGEAWGADFWKEQTAFWSRARSTYFPFTVWSVRKWHGKYINTDENEMGTWRRTFQSMSEGCKKADVHTAWVFGGSTVFGIGTPDWATIPSYLSKKLNADPSSCWEVTNLGVEGYVTNQEAILLMEQLKAGRHPDVAIFYDGVNESLVGGFSPGNPTEHWNFDLIRAKFEAPEASRLTFLKLSYTAQLIQQLRTSESKIRYPTLSNAELTANAQATLENYEANLQIIRMLSREHEFKTYFFWQPVLAFGNKPLAPFEDGLKKARDSELGGRVQRGLTAVYAQAEHVSEAKSNFVFLGHAFDDVRELIYVDEFHLDPRGNEIMADHIANAVQRGSDTR